MADTDIIVSEMTPASQINTGDLMIMTQPDAQAETGYSTKSATVLQVANKQLKGIDFPTDLPSFNNPKVLGGLEELKADIKALLPVSSASGNPCTFETNLADKLVSLKANITASGGGGTPAAPIPIVGYSACNVQRCEDAFVPLFSVDSNFRGIVAWNQLFPIMSATYSETGWNSTFGNDGSVTINVTDDTASANSPNISNLSANVFTSNHKYAFLGSTNNIFFKLKGFSKTANTIFNCSSPVYNNIGVDFINLARGTYKCYLQLFDLTAMFGSTIADYIYSLEQATTGAGVAFFKAMYPNSYYPYDSGTTSLIGINLATIPLGSTVYGGSIDVTRGKLTITHVCETINSFSGSPEVNGFRTNTYLSQPVKEAYGALTCNMFTRATNYNQAVGQVKNSIGYNDSRQLLLNAYVNGAYITDINDINALIPEGGCQIVYELATPIEIDVSALSVDTIVGVNNIVSDCVGDVEVTYIKKV